MSLNISSITIDCADPQGLATFWSAVLDAPVGPDATTEFSTVGFDSGLTLTFVAVPESKVVKNRVHIDLSADDIAAEVARLRSLGASELSTYDEGGACWTTLRDLEGNEFCVVG